MKNNYQSAMKLRFIFFILFLVLNNSLPVVKIQAQEPLTNLPSIYIETDNKKPIESKFEYVSGSIVIKSNDISENLTMKTEIRGRGNSTWSKPKQPYRIKLESKTNILNLPAKAKSWVLLANYCDKSLMRNALAFKVSEYLGMEFTPAFRFVDLFINDTYKGNYMLTDQVEVRKSRVGVEEQEKETHTHPDLSGGYLLEIGGLAFMEPNFFGTPQWMSIAVKYPKDDEINKDQLDYIEKFVTEFENALFSENFTDPEKGYRSMVDEHSLVNWYIASELTGNSDAFWSTYLYKYRNNDKLFFGPLWDFDIAFNNDKRLNNAEKKLMREDAHANKTWIQQLWKDEWFRNAVGERWRELVEEENILEKLLNYIDETRVLIDASQKKNYEVWKTLGVRVYEEYHVFSTYDEEIDYLKQYVQTRMDFLTESFNHNGGTEGPFVSENYYYLIKNEYAEGNITVENSSMEENAKLCIWEEERDNFSQHWRFFHVKDNNYQIINRKSDQLIAEGEENNLIQKKSNENDSGHLWRIISLDQSEFFALENTFSGLVIDNSRGERTNGNPLIQYKNEAESNKNQQWTFEKIEKINTTGILNAERNNVSVYPNPVKRSGILNVKIDESISGEIFSLQIYDVNGHCYFNQEYNTIHNQIIELPLKSINMCYGLYILRIITGGNSYNKKLFIYP